MKRRNEQIDNRNCPEKQSRLSIYIDLKAKGHMGYSARRRRKRRQKLLRRWVPIILCSAVFVLSAAMLGNYLVNSNRARQTEKELLAHEPQEEVLVVSPTTEPAATPTAAPEPQILPAYQHIGTEISAEMAELYRKNDDLVGWIKIPSVVSVPVVYRDNSYYLTHDFYGRKSSSGAVFLDEKHPLTEKTQNLLLYGHNMHDGTIFGHFGYYRRSSYWKEHCIAQFSTLYSQEYYVIFAVMVVPTEPRLPDYVNFAGHPVFYSVSEFDAYISEVRARSLHTCNIDVNASDALLTMATCLDEERVVLVARRVRDGETMEQLMNAIAPKH